jgi:hypothetical protein
MSLLGIEIAVFLLPFPCRFKKVRKRVMLKTFFSVVISDASPFILAAR